MYEILLPIHIAAGVVSLFSAFSALVATKGETWHVYFGRIFFAGMTVVFLTALPITLIRPNLFLFLIAIFSFYLVFTGWLKARNRKGVAGFADWVAAIVMSIASIGMWIVGTIWITAGELMGIVLLVFGTIGGASGFGDFYLLRKNRFKGKFRIAAHLTRMLGGTIAAVTAFVVVNVEYDPAFVLWLAPTALIVPIIVYWNIKVLRPGGAF